MSTLANKDQTWLITGGCGFIGTNLIDQLQRSSVTRIRVLDNLSVGSRQDLSRVCDFEEVTENQSSELSGENGKAALVIGDIRDYQTCLNATQDVDILVHLAANTGVAPSVDNPRADMEANVTGTFNMLEAARQNRCQRFVFASSGAPIGECTPPIHEEMAARPVSPYGASKLACEGYCSAYFRTFGLKTACLRFGNVYGPGLTHKSSVVAKFIRQAMNGKTCEIYGDGSQTRDFIFIQDLTSAIMSAACFEPPESGDSSIASSRISRPWGETYQIATSKEHTVSEIAALIRSQLHDVGINMAIEHTNPRLGDVHRNYSDTTKARNVLHWQAQTDVKAGIKQTIDWFINNQGC